MWILKIEFFNLVNLSKVWKISYLNGSYEGGREDGCKNGYGLERINRITLKVNYINGKRDGKYLNKFKKCRYW